MGQKIERRKYPRIKDKNISIKLSGDGFNAITQSLDVSASGLYCKVDRHMPVMTRVQIILSLPGKNSSSPSITMNIDGVVVREHPVEKDGRIQYYDVAIFFNTLLPKERKLLVQYINRRSK
ncbi:MAG: PilZ domain-containing protein [Candidatus Omnitrophota bacterium]